MTDRKTEWDIARDAADAISRAAHAAGYEAKPGRGVFLHSDMLELADGICSWLTEHMQPEIDPDPEIDT